MYPFFTFLAYIFKFSFQCFYFLLKLLLYHEKANPPSILSEVVMKICTIFIVTKNQHSKSKDVEKLMFHICFQQLDAEQTRQPLSSILFMNIEDCS